MKRLLVLALVATLTACGSHNTGGSHSTGASQNPCDATALGAAIDEAAASPEAPAKRGDDLDDVTAAVVQCENQSATARTDPKDPLNLQVARGSLAAGKAYALAGQAAEARTHFAAAAFTAKFIGSAQLEADANAAMAALH